MTSQRRAALADDRETVPRAPLLGGRARLTANLLGIPFGLAGLAQCWTTAHVLGGVPAWPGDLCWVVAAVLWAVVSTAYLWRAAATGRVLSETRDPTFAPFTSLIFITPMLLGLAWARHQPQPGTAVFLGALVLTTVYGGWLTGEWILNDLSLAQWHPGYFLPTVAGGLVAAAGSAARGYAWLAELMLGYGTICWFALGSIMLLRLFTQPALPEALVPTIAIEIAPPVVAGNAWFEINGNRGDRLALFLAGYALVMLLVQVRLLPVYARLRFGPGWWAFSFTAAATGTVAVRWLALEHASHRTALTYVVLAVLSAGLAALSVRTLTGLAHGTFLLREPSTATPAPAGSRA